MLPTFFPVPIIDISHAIQIISFRIVQSFATLKKSSPPCLSQSAKKPSFYNVGLVFRENNHKNFFCEQTIQNQYPQHCMNHINVIGHSPRISHGKEWLQTAELRFFGVYMEYRYFLHRAFPVPSTQSHLSRKSLPAGTSAITFPALCLMVQPRLSEHRVTLHIMDRIECAICFSETLFFYFSKI